MSASNAWIQVFVEFSEDDELEAWVMMQLLSAGADAISEEQIQSQSYGAAGRKLLCTSFEREQQAVVEELLSVLGTQPRLGVSSKVLEDDSWLHQWREFHYPRQVSARLAIRPPWRDFDAPQGVQVLIVEPGMAFGTGGHETTRLCMVAIDEHLQAHPALPSMLDVGCGSGVLAIAAAKLGVQRCAGVDNDPDAITISAENAAANQVSAQFLDVPVEALDERFDLVVANIISSVLLGMREALLARTKPGGMLLLSGLLTVEKQTIIDAFEASGPLRCVRAREESQWLCLEFL